jgi:hypothetical protein
MALVTFFSFTFSKPSWTASYPSESSDFTWVTTLGPASTTVQATLLPSSSKTLVIPTFFPINPLLIILVVVQWYVHR